MTDSDSEEREERKSDLPVDLSREREAFVRHFLRKGVELTEGLIEENKGLRAQLAEAQRDNSRLRAQVASDDAIRDLIKTIDRLEEERNKLIEQSSELQESTRRTEHRNTEVEQELHDLANLYIASSHLHSTLSVRGVMRHLGELLQQLVGAEVYAVYLLDDEEARPVLSDGIELGEVSPVRVGEGVVGEVMMTGIARVSQTLQPGGTVEAPIAAIPLMVRERAVGAISIASVFEQKDRWVPVDRELFKLMGNHAAIAVIAACQFADIDDPIDALRGIDQHLNRTPSGS